MNKPKCNNCGAKIKVSGLCIDCYEDRINQNMGIRVMSEFLRTGHCPILVTKGEERPVSTRCQRVIILPDYWKDWEVKNKLAKVE